MLKKIYENRENVLPIISIEITNTVSGTYAKTGSYKLLFFNGDVVEDSDEIISLLKISGLIQLTLPRLKSQA